MKSFFASVFLFLLFVPCAGAQGRGDNGRINWNTRAPWGTTRREAPVSEQKIEPFKVFDNVYYVGTQVVSSFLVTTTGGLVLIDSTNPETADALLNGVRTLGFDPANIKYIFVTHSHDDHYGGAGRIKQITGTRVAMSAEDWDVVERSQRAAQGRGQNVVTLARDVVVKDGQTVTVGDTVFKFYFTPGHTPGATSVEFQAKDGGKSYRTVNPGGLGISFGPEQNATYLGSVSRLKQLGPWDVVLGNHPFLMPRDLAEVKKDLVNRGQGAHPAAVGPKKIDEWFDAISKTIHEKELTERNR